MRGNYNIDFMLSLGIFLSGLFLFYTLYPTVQNVRFFHDEERDLAYIISEKIITSPGEPKDWDDIDEVESLGLAYFDGVNVYPNTLDIHKTNEIYNYNCSQLKEKVGIDTEFAIEIIGQGYYVKCYNNNTNPQKYVERIIRITPNGIAYIDGVLRVYV